MSENHAICQIMWKNMDSQTGHRWQYTMVHVICLLGN